MKKFIPSVFIVLSIGFVAAYFTSEPVLAGSGNQEKLIAAHIHPRDAVIIDEVFSSAISEDITISTTGVDVKYPVAAIVTPQTSYPTPAAGSTLTRKLSIIAAGAPTATFVNLPPASSFAGESVVLAGQSSNPVAIVPQGSDTVNASAAATPFSCAAGTMCECRAVTSSKWGCK